MKKKMFLMLFLLGTLCVHGQTKIDTINLSKGEVLDILLISLNDNVEADLRSYFRTVLPVGKKYSFQSVPGFRITAHTQGNIRPSSLILGRWSSMDKREGFLSNVVSEVPDFHERRRKIWSYFGLKYYEVQENTSLIVDRSKFHVATALWTPEDNSDELYSNWIEEVNKSGGKVLIKLTDGVSPFGYRYDPEIFVITKWENQSDFEAFSKNLLKKDFNDVQHVNEFLLR